MEQYIKLPNGENIYRGDVVYIDDGQHKECVHVTHINDYRNYIEGESYHEICNRDEKWYRKYNFEHIQDHFPFNLDFFVSMFDEHKDAYKIEHLNNIDTIIRVNGDPIILIVSRHGGMIQKMRVGGEMGESVPICIINESIHKYFNIK